MALGGGRIAGGTFATRTTNSQAISTRSESATGSAMVARCPPTRQRRRRRCCCEETAFAGAEAIDPTSIAVSANGVSMAEASRRGDFLAQVAAHRVEVPGFGKCEVARAGERDAH